MVKIYKLKLTILQQEILRFLFMNAGRAFNARRLSKNLEVSQPAVSKAIPYLQGAGYIKISKDKESKRLSIELNLDNPLITGLKRAENLKMIYESGLVGFLKDNLPGCTIILFGSYSRGEDAVDSDIDIAVIGAKEKEIELSKFDKILERKVTINFYASFKSMHKNLLDNILNGIILNGGIEL